MLLRSLLLCYLLLCCLLLGIVPLIPPSAWGQPVLSTRSGLVDFFEGEVLVEEHAIPQDKGRFPELAIGSRLTTGNGMAEILLGPGVFLWVGHGTEVRMRNNALEDTQLELVKGSAILQSMDVPVGNAVMILSGASKFFAAPNEKAIIGLPQQELELWAQKRSQVISTENLNRAAARKKVGRSSRRPYPTPVTPFPGRL